MRATRARLKSASGRNQILSTFTGAQGGPGGEDPGVCTAAMKVSRSLAGRTGGKCAIVPAGAMGARWTPLS